MTMTPALTAAAERLISLPGFCWMPGMVDVEGYRVLSCYDCGTYRIAQDGDAFDSDALALPDLTDPATLGCVEQMVCDAWNDPGFTLYGERVYLGENHTPDHEYRYMAEPSSAKQRRAELLVFFSSRGEALVNALAAAVGAK